MKIDKVLLDKLAFYATMPRWSCSIGKIIVTLKQLLLITAECIQMVVGYLDIFVFEEFCFAF